MTHTQVAAVIVSYNVREHLLQCLAALEPAHQSGEIAEIVVVDNDSSDGSAAAVRAAYPSVLVHETQNRGYGAAVNIGVCRSTSPYVLALNPDTIVPIGTASTLATVLDQEPWVAIVAPRLVYPDGAPQPTRRRFPTRLTPLFESTTLQRLWPTNPWAARYLDAYTNGTQPQQQVVDWVVGACLLLRRSALVACGGFDEDFFLYSEEVELCWRLRRHGWHMLWVADVTVVHAESASAGQNTARRQLLFDQSRVRLAQRMYGPSTALLVRGGLLALYAAELGIESSKWILGHRRDLRRRRISTYLTLLRSGLRDDA